MAHRAIDFSDIFELLGGKAARVLLSKIHSRFKTSTSGGQSPRPSPKFDAGTTTLGQRDTFRQPLVLGWGKLAPCGDAIFFRAWPSRLPWARFDDSNARRRPAGRL